MADGSVENNVENKKASDEEECRCCERLKLEMNSVVVNLKSAMEIIRILKEELDSGIREVRNSAGTTQSKYYSDSDSSNSDETWFQVQRNLKSENPTVKQLPISLEHGETKDIEIEANYKAAKHIPVTVNAKIVTNNCESMITTTGLEYSKIIKFNSYERNVNKLNNVKKHAVRIIGDSHSRGNTIRISELLGNKYEVCGMIKPGAGTTEMVAQVNANYRRMGKKDAIVMQVGSNDVYKNNSKLALSLIGKFCEEVTNTNLILLDIPHRYDLEEISCVNKEIQIFNRKLRKVTKLCKHVTVLETSTNREGFTRHGMHLNRFGKRQLARQIMSEIMRVTDEKTDRKISLGWKLIGKRTDTSIELRNELEQHSDSPANKHLNMRQVVLPCRRTSTRTKKVPANRYSDFLWVNQIQK
jgi:hypothetical protein